MSPDRKFWIHAAEITTVVMLATGCANPTAEATDQPGDKTTITTPPSKPNKTPTPTPSPTPTATPIPLPPTATLTRTPTPEPSPTFEPTSTAGIRTFETEDRTILEQFDDLAREDQAVLTLERPWIQYSKTVEAGGYTFSFAALGFSTDNQRFVIIENADALLKDAADKGDLGQPVYFGPINTGFTTGNFRPSQIEVVTNSGADATGIPTAVLTAYTYHEGDEPVETPKDSNLEQMGEDAQALYKTARDIAIHLFEEAVRLVEEAGQEGNNLIQPLSPQNPLEFSPEPSELLSASAPKLQPVGQMNTWRQPPPKQG